MSIQFTTLVTAVAVGSSFFSATAARAESPVAILTQPPVALTACRIGYRFGFGDIYGPSLQWVNGLEVRFQNQRQVEANEVDLRLKYNGRETTIVDKGSFAPSTTIAHSFDSFDGSVYGGSTPDQCSVVAVHYVDGSAWHEKDSAPVGHVADTR